MEGQVKRWVVVLLGGGGGVSGLGVKRGGVRGVYYVY